jgi:hypothetical protein
VGKVLQANVASAQEALEQAEAAREVPLAFPSSSEAWGALSVPEKRKIITALIGRVVVRRERGPPRPLRPGREAASPVAARN